MVVLTVPNGFRSGHSCPSALLDVFDNIMHMLDNNPSVDMHIFSQNLFFGYFQQFVDKLFKNSCACYRVSRSSLMVDSFFSHW